MSITRAMALGLFVCALACSAAGDRLSIRLIEATNTKDGDVKGMEDVIVALKGSLVFKSYILAGRASQDLPAKGEKSRLGDLTVTCSGPQSNLEIVVHRGRRELLKTTVRLPDKKPLVLGGFPSKGGSKLVLVFLAE